MKLGSFGYLPPRGRFCSDAFAQNLKDFSHKHDLITYSDDDWEGAIRLKVSPEALRPSRFETGVHRGKENPFAIHNGLFLAGLKMCMERGITHAIYLEQDCRVGADGWDETIFEEYFSIGRPCIVAGTISVYNPSNFGHESLRRFYKHFADPPAHGIPTPTYGWVGADKSSASCAFPNGALAVYDVAWIASLFDVNRQFEMAANNTAFDMALGQKIFEIFGIDAYEVIGSLSSVFSGYGEVLTTVEERRELLASGKVVAYHQEKTNWIPPR